MRAGDGADDAAEATVYLVLDAEAGPRWSETAEARALEQTLDEAEVPPDRKAAELRAARARFVETRHVRPAVVGGAIVFEYAFDRPTVPCGDDARLRYFALARWRVHRLADGRFVVVRQRRRRLSPDRAARWQDTLDQIANTWRGAGLHASAVAPRGFVHAADDAARWTAEIEPPMGIEALLAFVDGSIEQEGRPHGPNDEVNLPFLLRKALIERGLPVPGVTWHGVAPPG